MRKFLIWCSVFLAIVVIAFHAAIAVQAGTVSACAAMPEIWEQSKRSEADPFENSGNISFAAGVIRGASRNWPTWMCYRGIVKVWLGQA